MRAGSVIYKHKSKNTAPPTNLLHWRPRFLVLAVYSSTKHAFWTSLCSTLRKAVAKKHWRIRKLVVFLATLLWESVCGSCPYIKHSVFSSGLLPVLAKNQCRRWMRNGIFNCCGLSRNPEPVLPWCTHNCTDTTVCVQHRHQTLFTQTPEADAH